MRVDERALAFIQLRVTTRRIQVRIQRDVVRWIAAVAAAGEGLLVEDQGACSIGQDGLREGGVGERGVVEIRVEAAEVGICG